MENTQSPMTEAAKLMGRVKSEKKTAAARRNVRKAHRARIENCLLRRMWKEASAEMDGTIRWPDGLIWASEHVYNPITGPFYRQLQLLLYQLAKGAGEAGITRGHLLTILRLKQPQSSVEAVRQYFSQFLSECRKRGLIREERWPDQAAKTGE